MTHIGDERRHPRATGGVTIASNGHRRSVNSKAAAAGGTDTVIGSLRIKSGAGANAARTVTGVSRNC